jgi:hypothetical protein
MRSFRRCRCASPFIGPRPPFASIGGRGQSRTPGAYTGVRPVRYSLLRRACQQSGSDRRARKAAPHLAARRCDRGPLACGESRHRSRATRGGPAVFAVVCAGGNGDKIPFEIPILSHRMTSHYSLIHDTFTRPFNSARIYYQAFVPRPFVPHAPPT